MAAAAVVVALMLSIDAKFWGVVVMGGAVIILFFLHGSIAARSSRSVTVQAGINMCMPCSSSTSSFWPTWVCRRRHLLGARITGRYPVLFWFLPVDALVEQPG